MIKLCIFCKHCVVEDTCNNAGFVDGVRIFCTPNRTMGVFMDAFTKASLRNALCTGLTCEWFELDDSDVEHIKGL